VGAEFWTADGSTLGPGVRGHRWSLARVWLDGLPLRLYRKARLFSAWSNNWQPSGLAAQINRVKPDLVHLHWIGGGFFSLRELPDLQMPVVWTLHDAWALTGGCHYPDRCLGYAAECGACPQLGSSRRHDLSWVNLRAKRATLDSVAAFVAPSTWLAGLVMASGITTADRLHVIPNGLDGAVFAPADAVRARLAMGLPLDAIVLAAGSQDLGEPRKGNHLLREVIEGVVKETRRPCVLVLFGAPGRLSKQDWPCEVRWLGVLSEEQQTVRVYNAADLLLMPSLQDNLPNMPLEALACGCPTVGFDAGGLKEIIEPGITGALATAVNAPALAIAVASWIGLNPSRTAVAARCRARFEEYFACRLHAVRLKSLYEGVLAGKTQAVALR
jgi:glycosyltransferase involved in cell wall biosynthesis